MTRRFSGRLKRLAIPAAALVAAAAASVFLLELAEKWAASSRVQSEGTADIGGAFTLTAHTGERVDRSDFRGQYRMIFFGFTHCPDVCPTELAKMTRALELLDDRGTALERLQPLFITVDPARDTPARLASYLDSFHPRLMGLTGSEGEIAAVTEKFAVHSAKRSGSEGDSGYRMAHTAKIYLMGPQGAFEEVFTPRETADDIAEAIGARVG